MSNVFPMRWHFEILHVGFQQIDLNSREPEHRPVVVDELPDERSRASQTLRLLLDGAGLFGREAEGLREVVIPCRGFGHGVRFPLSYRAGLASIIKARADRHRPPSDESLVEAQAAGLTLLFSLQGKVGCQMGQHSV